MLTKTLTNKIKGLKALGRNRFKNWNVGSNPSPAAKSENPVTSMVTGFFLVFQRFAGLLLGISISFAFRFFGAKNEFSKKKC